jgi:hypothetical protein
MQGRLGLSKPMDTTYHGYHIDYMTDLYCYNYYKYFSSLIYKTLHNSCRKNLGKYSMNQNRFLSEIKSGLVEIRTQDLI